MGNSTFWTTLSFGSSVVVGSSISAGLLVARGAETTLAGSGTLSARFDAGSSIIVADPHLSLDANSQLTLQSAAGNMVLSGAQFLSTVANAYNSGTTNFAINGVAVQIGSGGTTAGLTTTGSGTLTLNGTNTFTGGLTINGGVVGSGSAGALTVSTNNGASFFTPFQVIRFSDART